MASLETSCEQRQHAFFQDLESPLMLLELFEFLPNVYLYVKDREGKFLRVNRFACQILGVACEREVVGKNDFDFFPGDCQPVCRRRSPRSGQREPAARSSLAGARGGWLSPVVSV
ncbi:MAG: PAS domain S-box protein [Planctomycetaceae bacterium]